MNTQFTEKPTLVNVIAWMTLASGIVNIFFGLVLTVSVLATFVGVVCTPFTILPTVLGIFEIIYAAKLLSNPPQAVQPSTALAILEIVTILVGNIFSVVVGILALVFYNDLTVRDYFARLNGLAPLVPVAPVAPVPPIPPVVPTPPAEPEPIVDEHPEMPIAPEEIVPESAPEETPEKPKRSRKVAGK